MATNPIPATNSQLLPSGATVKITVTSVNDAGESTPSSEVSVVVPGWVGCGRADLRVSPN